MTTTTTTMDVEAPAKPMIGGHRLDIKDQAEKAAERVFLGIEERLRQEEQSAARLDTDEKKRFFQQELWHRFYLRVGRHHRYFKRAGQ
jgi:hypothetical protein